MLWRCWASCCWWWVSRLGTLGLPMVVVPVQVAVAVQSLVQRCQLWKVQMLEVCRVWKVEGRSKCWRFI